MNLPAQPEPQATEARPRLRMQLPQVPDTVRVLITFTMVALACVSLWWAIQSQQAHPWTRDGQVLAQVVGVAPQVEGPVIRVHVTDNALVKIGAPLFDLDPRLYQQALDQARADLAQARAEASNARADAARADRLHQNGDLSDEAFELKTTTAESAEAALAAAQVRVDTARLKLQLTQVTAPVNGYVTNLTLDTGQYAQVGVAQLTLVNQDSFWIAGYFKETDLASIPVGAPAAVTLMSQPEHPLRAQVESVAHGIARRNLGDSPGGLAQVAPTFEWIRLAQRIPVRIRLLEQPATLPLRLGTTASVAILAVQDPTNNSRPR